jgi:hypothetical protein
MESTSYVQSSPWKVQVMYKALHGKYKLCTEISMESTSYSCQTLMKLEFSQQIYEKYSNFMKICPMAAKLLQADRRTDRQTDRQT